MQNIPLAFPINILQTPNVNTSVSDVILAGDRRHGVLMMYVVVRDQDSARRMTADSEAVHMQLVRHGPETAFQRCDRK
jgi:hypothetical protein